MIADKRKLISIVTPCYNEELNIQECYQVVKELFDGILKDYDYEHIFCDNCSEDNTLSILKNIAKTDKNIKVIANARNFGPFNSIFNGLKATSGDAVVPFLPADLQDPPHLIPQFIEQWQNGYDVVYGVRASREESFVLRNVRRLYYRLVNQTAHINIPQNVGEFSLIDKKVVTALREYDDYYPYLRGMIANCGFKSTQVAYRWDARKRGLSKNNLYALVDQGLNGLISFTNLPMRLCMFAGFGISIVSILYAFISLIIGLVRYREVAEPGVTTLIVALFFFSGVILFALGVMGEYISAIHFQVRKKPLVIEQERINF
jgi:glycosyltransferase involved in cell wall biosynthesis